MEQIKEYVNKDLYNLSEEDFYKKLDFPVDIAQESFEGQIEWALLLLNMKDSPIRYSEARSDFGLKAFDGAYLFTSAALSSSWKALNPNSEHEITPKLFDNNFDIKILSFSETTPLLTRYRTHDLKEKRGICLPNETALTEYLAFATTDDKWYTNSQAYKSCNIMKTPHKLLMEQALQTSGYGDKNAKYVINGEVFDYYQLLKKVTPEKYLYPIPNKSGYVINPKDIQNFMSESQYIESVKRYQMALSIHFSMHFEWSLYIQESENSIGFKTAINPTKLENIYSLRDLPTGEVRRKAICHFVKEHSRNRIVDGKDKTTLINRYLRGETAFNWNGLRLNIIPSKSDIINTKTRKKFLNK